MPSYPERGALGDQIRNVAPLVATAFLIAAAGLLPHLWLSLSSHEISYFKYAYDEEFYSEAALDGKHSEGLGRVASGILMRGLHTLTGSNIEPMLVMSDAVWPFLSTLAAAYLASSLTRRTLPRIMLVLLLLFGQEFFSLGCTAVWNSSFNLSSLRALFPPWGALIIPDYGTSYFSLYRTPEPQISWIIEFASLGLLARHFCDEQSEPGLRHWLALLVLDLCLSSSQVFCAFPVLVLQLLLAARALVVWEGKHFAGIGGLALLAMSRFMAQPSTSTGSSLLFHSRLPIVTPSVVAGGVVALFMVSQYGRDLLRSRRAYLAFAAVAMPMLLMDQQLVTGRMISTRDWERYANYPMLILGVALFALHRSKEVTIPSLAKPRGTILVLFTLVFVTIRGQKSSFDQWRPQNEVASAQLNALRKAAPVFPSPELVLQDVSIAPLLQLKAGRPLHFVLAYNELFENPIANMPALGGSPVGREAHQERLFEYFARSGKSPQEVAQILTAEAAGRGGFFLGFLFSFLDYWYPASDNRLVRQDEIVAQIDHIVDLYRQYEMTPHARWSEPTLFLTTTAPHELRDNPRWANVYLASGRSASNPTVTVYAYRQTLRDNLDAEHVR